MSHALAGYSFRFSDFQGLSASNTELVDFAPTTLLVGRNNVGKSALINALRFAIDRKVQFNNDWHRLGRPAKFFVHKALADQELRAVFSEGTSGGGVPGINWWAYGERFVGLKVGISFDQTRTLVWHTKPDFAQIQQDRDRFERDLLARVQLPDIRVFTIAAERNVVPEGDSGGARPVSPSGAGLTDLVRAFLTDSSLRMEEVETSLLSDLNEIYEGDEEFNRILIRRDGDGNWEIFLSSKSHGVVRLSNSGSSLKSIFIILATLRLNPLTEGGPSINSSVFCIEEPENNLHPSLLRRLLSFLDRACAEVGATLIITTHSAAAIDWASRKNETAIYHLERSADGTVVNPVREYGSTRKVLDDLDVRASELLQANGVIWVEGPSDRIYVNGWIRLASAGELQEGVHYSVVFYGGKLLSHLSAGDPSDAGALIDILRMNRNGAVLMDSDKKRYPSGVVRSNISDTKKRIMEEAELSKSLVWLTAGKEIENYVSDRITTGILGSSGPVDQFESVPDAVGRADKIAIATEVVSSLTSDDLDTLDLRSQVELLCERIRAWNRIK